METTDKKECPKCGSKNINDSGNRMGDVVTVLPGREIPEPTHVIYECKDCGEQFFIEEKE